MIRIDFIIKYLTSCKSIERWKMIVWTINCLFIGGIISILGLQPLSLVAFIMLGSFGLRTILK